MDRYIIGSQIGKGEFGVCYAATKKDDPSGTEVGSSEMQIVFVGMMRT